jgi:hypothetical protein
MYTSGRPKHSIQFVFHLEIVVVVGDYSKGYRHMCWNSEAAEHDVLNIIEHYGKCSTAGTECSLENAVFI